MLRNQRFSQLIERFLESRPHGAVRFESGAHLHLARLPIAHEQHENRVSRRERRRREVVEAVVEHAHRSRREHPRCLHKRRALDVERAQISSRLVEDELEPLAVEVGVAFLRQDKPAFALAVRDEQLHLHEPLATGGCRDGVASLRQVVEQLAYTLRLAFERALDLGKQRAGVLLAMEGHRELPIALEHGVRAPQLRLPLGKQAPALIERRHVLGQKRVAAHHRIHLEQRRGNG